MGSLGKQQNRARTFSRAWVTVLFEGICELLEGDPEDLPKTNTDSRFSSG